VGQITLSGNAVVSGNTISEAGGGIATQGAAVMLNDNAKITENTATEEGGGVYGTGDNAGINWGEDLVIT
jgi:predicted outer membrane repeat protein